MLTYTIYLIVAAILLFVVILAAKAISRGIDAKNNFLSEIKKEDKDDIVDKINKLKTLYTEGHITEEEFKKAKKKLLDL